MPKTIILSSFNFSILPSTVQIIIMLLLDKNFLHKKLFDFNDFYKQPKNVNSAVEPFLFGFMTGKFADILYEEKTPSHLIRPNLYGVQRGAFRKR